MTDSPKLIDGNLLLRRHLPEDVEPVFAAVRESIAEISRWMPWCHEDYSLEESRTWIESRPDAWAERREFEFVMVDNTDGSLIGGCGLNNINWTERFANLGYWVRTSRAGKGIASSAAKLLARFGLEELELNRIEIVAAVDNVASRRAAEKAGAMLEGVLRKRLVVGDTVHDAAMYSIVGEDLDLR